MSEELSIPRAVSENEKASGYTEMPVKKPDEEKPIYTGPDAVREAARDVSKERASSEPPLVDRHYRNDGGKGDPTPSNQTLTAERAADDLKAVREREAQIEAEAQAAQLADAVDGLRNPQPIDQGDQGDALERARAAIAKAQAEHGVVPEQQPAADGLDAVRQALANPIVADALRGQIEGVEQARQQYATAAMDAARVATAAVIAAVPELQGLPPDQIAGALAVIERQSPARADAIKNQLSRIERLVNVSNQVQQQQQQLELQRIQSWAKQESDKFDQWSASPQNAERLKSVMPHAPQILAEYGIGKAELSHLLKTQPLLHSAVGQQILLDAISYRHAQKTAMQNPVPKSVPHVQRPGVATDRSRNSSEVDSAVAAFRANPNPKTGAAMLRARRAASS